MLREWVLKNCKFAQQATGTPPPQLPTSLPPIAPPQLETPVDLSKYDAIYPRAGAQVSGLTVRSQVPNMGSIRGLSSDYEILKGVREVSMDKLNTSPESNFYASDDHNKWSGLVEQIKASGEINPLIVVHDKEAEAGTNGPYILEGGHRLVALGALKVKSFPAMVVIDFEAING